MFDFYMSMFDPDMIGPLEPRVSRKARWNRRMSPRGRMRPSLITTHREIRRSRAMDNHRYIGGNPANGRR